VPLIWTDVCGSYSAFRRSAYQLLIPYWRMFVNRYRWEILSNACLKSSVRRNCGLFLFSYWTIASQISARAWKIDFPGSPHYWLDVNCSARIGQSLLANIRTRSFIRCLVGICHRSRLGYSFRAISEEIIIPCFSLGGM
jgi:hypothetical protein